MYQVGNDRYLRANKRQGHYNDLDHYLDVQFRLLREDFVAPLREGINDYIQAAQDHNKKKQKDVRIYHNVRLISPEPGENGLCYVIQFDVSRMGRVRWHSTKRLIFGSLVCLSSDNFRTFHFASVVNRDVKNLAKGFVVVRFEQEQGTVKQLFGQHFVMAETTAYFESYRHVLTGLQNMRPGELPFERYIVECESHVQAPAYLRRRQNTVYDLRPLVDEQMVLRDNRRLEILLGAEEEEEQMTYNFSEHSEPAKDVKILNEESWPPADLLHLDASQFKAIKTALTKEFAITQGPPGTGKTYIGLKIVKALLHNKQVWSKHPDNGLQDNRPMLIVCYTNHALDQFLEGIISFYKGDVIRVGGRSQSEVLKPYNLHNFRARMRHERKIPVQVFRGRREAKYEMDSIWAEIGKVSVKLQTASCNIMHEDFLRPFMGEHQFMMLTNQFMAMLQVYPEAAQMFTKRHSIIVEWLQLGNLATIVEMESNAEAMFEGQEAENDPEIEMIDVENEIDAIEAQRQLDEGDEDYSSDDEFNVYEDMTRKQILDMQIKMAEHEQQRAVALKVDQIGHKPKEISDGEWQTQKNERKKTKRKIQRNLTAEDIMSEEEAQTIVDIWRLNLEDKWKLYRLWLKKYSDYLFGQIDEKLEEFEAAAKRYREALMQEDKEIMRHSTVIGMTTTGAARYQAIMQEIRPRIVVVEEAAEVLEAHIITTLSRGCEQLILIGDHQQLKPNPTVYKLATDYNLDVSLFERMVENGVQCDCLQLQHRMRPEISELMKHIYKDLKDHEDVLKYEDIKGISSNMFFVNHHAQETHEDDLRSHSNDHEAQYIVGLCKYLLMQGYKPEKITILTLYSGQLFLLKNMMPKDQFDGVKVTVVDNYQGEENDIILLSLVRSNDEGSIGFLKIDNRVCVALSRAKKGFYAIGNFDLLQTKSHLWKEIVIDMKQRKLLSDGLVLYCQNHPNDDPIVVKHPNDFNKAPEGGCRKKCGFRLNCGHSCEMFCHVTDQSHEDYICRKPCGKVICKNNHRCRGRCSDKCKPCSVLVEKIIPACGHIQLVPCSVSAGNYECKEACTYELKCGHKCQSKCGMAHTKDCTIPVEKDWPCGHKGTTVCYQKDIAPCPEPCNMVLNCEHRCQGTCGKCMQGRLHRACHHGCTRILVCGHECLDFCSQCPPCRRECENRCQHNRCQKRCGELCAPCREPCTWQCEHYKCTNLCGEPCNRPRCDQPCRKRLTCGHECIGLCGEKCPTYCRICDEQKVTQIFFGDEDEPGARFVLMEDCRTRCIIEVNAMDTFMDSNVDERGEIKLKECPKCKTPIRSTTRYRSIVNRILKDIEKAKGTVLANKGRIRDLEQNIKENLETLSRATIKLNLKRRLNAMKDPKSENALAALLNQITFAKHIDALQDDWSELRGVAFEGEKERGLCNLKNFMGWVLEQRSVMTPQEIQDAEMELARSRAHLKILLYQMKAQDKGIRFDIGLKTKVMEAEKMLNGHEKYDGVVKIVVETCLGALEKVVPRTGLGITNDERIMIVQAMQLPKGHWFKCPQGTSITFITVS